ncbi:glycosyltransferase family 2 protein [Desulforamulus aeronauticus]|uniref:Glycosyltransferase involved in cell wall bisynthesis n=1 Tax=Desulforamulus aeronauticus DSM 10349 TaxID=1121421 RepID=A0A1M6WV96_9FIRM|nr:glycosyltransferase family 2 protein [Desulforamulus aeronauticus]SHK97692.1 Glycosyltransferase involved in cell wall bisynthesis [Desulforamulus aeronauticus DSM 10349]
MITISLCMIVKNEEAVLGRCLDSVANLVDEIIILDTGSTDSTKSIAAQYTNQIFDFNWIEDFSAARNAAFTKATMDYILWLDADDVLETDDQMKFGTLKEDLDTTVDSVTMKYHLAFDEDGNVSFSTRRNRLVKRANNFQWIGAVHEYLEIWGNIMHSDIAITHKSLHHDSDRNLKIYEKRLEQGEEFSPRDLYYFANELLDHQMYERAATFYEKFLSEGKGWVEDNISSCGKLADCYHALGDYEQELQAVLRSFRYGSARAEFCCRLGYYFIDQGDLTSAIFWYKLATQVGRQENHPGFLNPAFSTWLPHLQLCVCYDRLGMHKLAYLHNEVARQYRPKDCKILQNQKFLEALLQEKNDLVNKN